MSEKSVFLKCDELAEKILHLCGCKDFPRPLSLPPKIKEDYTNEDDLIFRAIKDTNPTADVSAVQKIINNYEMILRYQEIVGEKAELTPALLYKLYQKSAVEKDSKVNDNLASKSVDPNVVSKAFREMSAGFESSDAFRKYCRTMAVKNLWNGWLRFRADILTGKIKLPARYESAVTEVKERFLRENEESILLHIIEDRIVPNIYLSPQAGEMRKQCYREISEWHDSPADKEARKRLIYDAYRKADAHNLLAENRGLMEDYIHKQLVPIELKLDKVLSSHAADKKKEKEVIFEFLNGLNPPQKISLVKQYIPSQQRGKNAPRIFICSNGEIGKDFGEYSDDNQKNSKGRILRYIEDIFLRREGFREEIGDRYHRHFQFQAGTMEKAREKAKAISTFRNTRSGLLDALYEGKLVAVANQSDRLVNNHTFKLLVVNDAGEVVCLELSKTGPYLLNSINGNDWDRKFRMKTYILAEEKLYEVIEESTRANTSSKIFPKDFLGRFELYWDINENTLNKSEEYEFIESIRMLVNTTIAYTWNNSRNFDHVINERGDSGALSNVYFAFIDKPQKSMYDFCMFEQDRNQKEKFTISIMERYKNTQSCFIVKAKKENDKFVLDAEEYSDEEKEKRKGYHEILIDALNRNLRNEQPSIQYYSAALENKKCAKKIFEFQYNFDTIERRVCERILREAESDGIGKLDALYKEDELYHFLSHGHIFTGKKYSEEKIDQIRKMQEKDAATALRKIGLRPSDIERLETVVEIFEKQSPIELIAMIERLLYEIENAEINDEEDEAWERWQGFSELEGQGEEAAGDRETKEAAVPDEAPVLRQQIIEERNGKTPEEKSYDEKLYEKALAMIETSNQAKGVEMMRNLAEQGCAKAQYQMGLMHYNGFGVDEDYIKAVEWYQKAARQGEKAAQSRLQYLGESY